VISVASWLDSLSPAGLDWHDWLITWDVSVDFTINHAHQHVAGCSPYCSYALCEPQIMMRAGSFKESSDYVMRLLSVLQAWGWW
jgi:hypothetical protein